MATSDEGRRAPSAARLPLNEVRRTDAGVREAPSRDIPAALQPHYHQDGNAYRSAHRNDKIEFVDRGHRMHAYRPVSQFTARALAQIAESRQWQQAEITGDKKFQSQAYVELKARGIEVAGYQPTEKDQEILQRREDRVAARANPAVQAFAAATTAKAQSAAAKKYPELKEAFAVRAAISKVAEQIPDPKGRENWQGAMTDRLTLAIHRREPMPEVKLREAPARSREAEQSR